VSVAKARVGILPYKECREVWCNAPRMAYDGGSHDWELDELESMKAVHVSSVYAVVVPFHPHVF